MVTIADYEEVLADHRRLVRELDIALNGEDGAARQASLCDIVSQVKSIKRELSWLDYPANTPKQSYPSIPLSHPLLFVNVDDGKTYIRLGYFDNEDECFYESGDEKKLPWVHTVTKFFTFPYPETAKTTQIEGGK